MVRPTRVTNRIKTLREEHGLTQAQLASQLGVTRQTVNAIEQGKYSPTLELAFQVARIFAVPIEQAFGYPEGPAGGEAR